MKKSLLVMICVLLCMFAFTAGVSAETELSYLTDLDIYYSMNSDGSEGQLNFSSDKSEYDAKVPSRWSSPYIGVEVAEDLPEGLYI
ncbi:MAG: hypothetical protein IJF43_05595, partial [Firmicutes bacterium]|nr:hypothetical protein [Bacillota bacterium]